MDGYSNNGVVIFGFGSRFDMITVEDILEGRIGLLDALMQGFPITKILAEINPNDPRLKKPSK